TEATLPLRDVADIDPAIFRKARMHRHVQQAALPARDDLRQSLYAYMLAALGLDQVKPPFALGDQHAAIGQKRQCPGVAEPFGNGLHAKRLLLAAMDFSRIDRLSRQDDSH